MRRYSSFVIRRRQWQRTTAKIAEKRCSLATGSVCSPALVHCGSAHILVFYRFVNVVIVSFCISRTVCVTPGIVLWAGPSYHQNSISYHDEQALLPFRWLVALQMRAGSVSCLKGVHEIVINISNHTLTELKKKLKAGDFWWAGWW